MPFERDVNNDKKRFAHCIWMGPPIYTIKNGHLTLQDRKLTWSLGKSISTFDVDLDMTKIL
jgi:hypothetical protein